MIASPTTILFFDHTAKMGGGEISLLNLVTHLDRKRFDPVVVLASEGPLRQKLSEAGVETHVLPLSEQVTGVRKDSLTGPRILSMRQIGEITRYIWRLRSFARARGAQILHTNSLKADIIGAVAGRLAGLPIIWHVRDRIADDYLPSAATRVFRVLCRVLPHYVVVNSVATLESLHLPARQNARVIYNGIIHDGLPASSKNDGTNEGGEPDPSPCIGLVGRISPWKGQDVFLRAAAMVRQKYPGARFQIIGSPLFGEEDYERELHELCAHLELEGNAEWLGFRSDVLELVAGMTMLVHASKTGEPFGQVVVEAMMVGRPVVATNGGGVPEIVLEGQTGVLVPMDDAEAMAVAILRLLDDPPLAQAMGQAGRKRAMDKFTIEHTVAKISSLYRDVLDDRQEKPRRWLWLWIGAGVLIALAKTRKEK